MGIIFIIFSVLIAGISILGIIKQGANNIFPITGILIGMVLAVFGFLML